MLKSTNKGDDEDGLDTMRTENRWLVRTGGRHPDDLSLPSRKPEMSRSLHISEHLRCPYKQEKLPVDASRTCHVKAEGLMDPGEWPRYAAI